MGGLVVIFTLLSAALSAFSAAGEQRAASHPEATRHLHPLQHLHHHHHAAPHPATAGPGAPDPPAKPRPPRRGAAARQLVAGIGFATALISSPLWLASLGIDVAGFFAQAIALQIGSVSVVQPLMATTLLFALPLSAWGHRYWPHARDWAGALAICAGLALMLSTRHVAGAEETPTPALPASLGIIVAAVIVLILIAARRRPGLRAPLLSVSAGALFAVGASITKLAGNTLLSGGLLGLATSWPGYALAVVSVASFAIQQLAYGSGALATAIAAEVITDPLISYLLGVAGFGEPAPTPGLPLVLTIIGVGLLAAGIYTLAHSPLLSAARQPELPPHTLAREHVLPLAHARHKRPPAHTPRSTVPEHARSNSHGR
jgi:drug/metabolite transporter (DMT)-like permease